MPGPVRQTRQAVARTKAAALEKLSRGEVDLLARDSRPNGVEGRSLRTFFNAPHALDLGRRFAENIGTGDIRVIPANRQPVSMRTTSPSLKD